MRSASEGQVRGRWREEEREREERVDVESRMAAIYYYYFFSHCRYENLYTHLRGKYIYFAAIVVVAVAIFFLFHPFVLTETQICPVI